MAENNPKFNPCSKKNTKLIKLIKVIITAKVSLKFDLIIAKIKKGVSHKNHWG